MEGRIAKRRGAGGIEAFLVNAGVIPLLVVVTELNEDVVGLVSDEFVQFRGQGFEGGAILGVVQNRGAAVKAFRKGRTPTGLFRDRLVADETNGERFFLSLTNLQAQEEGEGKHESHHSGC